MVKCHVRTFRQDLSVTRDQQIDWNPTVYTWDMGDYLPQEYFDYVCKKYVD